MSGTDENAEFLVVRNVQGEYALWKPDVPIPVDWYAVMTGTENSCRSYIAAVWAGARPKTLRDITDRDGKNSG